MDKFSFYLLTLFLLFNLITSPTWGQESLSPKQLQEKLLTVKGEERVKVLNELASSISQVDSIENYAKEAYELAVKLDNQLGIIRALLNQSRAYHYKGRHVASLEKAHKAEKIVFEQKFKDELWLLYRYLGIGYSSIGNRIQAVEYFIKSLENARDQEDPYKILVSLNNLGTAHIYQKNFGRALEYYMQALEIPESSQFPNIKITVLANLGEVYMNRNDLTSSEKFLNQALSLAIEDALPLPQCFIYNNLGLLASKKGNLKQALNYLDRAFSLSKKLNSERLLNVTYQNLGKVHLNAKNYLESETSFQKSLQLAKRSNNQDLKLGAYENLVRVDSARQDFTSAFLYQKKYQALSDSIFDSQKNQQIEVLQAKYKDSEVERENTLLKAEQESQKSTIQLQFWISMLAFILVLFLSIGLFYFYRTLRRQKRHQSHLIKLNSQIQSKNNALKQSNDIKNKLFSIISHDLRSPLNTLIPVVTLLREKRLSEAEQELVISRLDQQLRNTSSLLDNLLYWTKSQMEGIKTSPQELKLRGMGLEALELYQVLIKSKSIETEFLIEEDMKVWADRDVLKLILRNLVHNALKYTYPNGKIQLRAFKKAETPEKIWVEVKDNGVGMDSEMLNKILQKNSEQESKLGTEQEKGTGLGLGLVQDFVDQLDGEFEIESQPHLGSSFRFSLPIKENLSL